MSQSKSDAFELISKVIGQEMNNAFVNIMDKLNNSRKNGDEKISIGGKEVTKADLKEFFDVLNGIGVDFAFYPGIVKGLGLLTFANSLDTKDGKGGVSIGLNVTF